MYLFYQYKNPYADEIAISNDVYVDGRKEGKALLIKRTYKNGKVTFVNKRYE